MESGAPVLSDLTVVVAGANGRMGSLFAAEMESLGAKVLRVGRKDLADDSALSSRAGHLTVDPSHAARPECEGSAPADRPTEGGGFAPDFVEAAKKANLVLLCVPVALTGPVASRLEALLPIPASAVWCDIASVKSRPMRHLAEVVRGPVVGTHPLFGPSAKPGAPERRTAVIAGERAAEQDVALVERVFSALGCVTFRGTPESHDRAVAIFQSLNFLTSAALFAVAATTPDILPYLTPSFQRRANASRLIMLDDGELFTGLTFQNEEVRPMLEKFIASLSRFLENPENARAELEAARSWWT